MTTFRRADKGQMHGGVVGKEGKVYNYHNHPGLKTTFKGGLKPKLTKRNPSRSMGAKNEDLRLKTPQR